MFVIRLCVAIFHLLLLLMRIVLSISYSYLGIFQDVGLFSKACNGASSLQVMNINRLKLYKQSCVKQLESSCKVKETFPTPTLNNNYLIIYES